MSTNKQKLLKLIDIEKKLENVRDIDMLRERILTETRRIVHADAGSVYEVDGGSLRIRYAQNDTLQKRLEPGEKMPYLSFSFPIDEKSIAGYVAYSGEPLNIEDARKIPSGMPFSFNTESDKRTGYHTKSIYTLPLKMASGELVGVMQLINAQNKNGRPIAFSNDAVMYITHFALSMQQNLQNTYQTNLMVQRMLKMTELRDPKETYTHTMRVAEFSVEIYDRYAFTHKIPEKEMHEFRDCLKIAAKFHDIGKVGVADDILHSTVRFGPNDISRRILEGHTCVGAQIFMAEATPLDKMCREVALHHHEAWAEGSVGYPGKIDYRSYKIGEPLPPAAPIHGTEIPLAARIVAVADVFDALSHKRSYKSAWSFDDAVAEIEKEAGAKFDPEIVKAFLHIKERIRAIQNAYPHDD